MKKESPKCDLTMSIAFKKVEKKGQYKTIAHIVPTTVNVSETRVRLAQKNFIRKFKSELEDVTLTDYEKRKIEKLIRLTYMDVNNKNVGKSIIRTRRHSKYFISFDREIAARQKEMTCTTLVASSEGSN